MRVMEDMMVPEPADGVVVDPMDWFDTPGPFELEIGCGKGGFLLARARNNPDLRMLGIEWANKYYKYIADRLARWDVPNARVMRTDAGHFVRHHLPPQCLTALHIYHPDPWPKKRHHKRRLFQPAFVEAAIRATKPQGMWYVQSDHAEYFAWIQELLATRPELVPIPWEQSAADAGPEWSGTNFEIKYVREGRTIHRTAYRVQ